jgi:tousled-like kinase
MKLSLQEREIKEKTVELEKSKQLFTVYE